MYEYNELIRCERAESNQKHDAILVVRNESNNELNLELIAEVDRKD